MAYITCQDAAFGYDGKTVISGLNFTVNAGDYLCIIGENGSGKSTMIKGLLHLITPLAGQVQNGDGLKSSEIGYLPQQSAVQKDFPAGVYEVVLSGCQNKQGFRPFYSAADKKKALDNMKRLQITELKNKCYRELSGGQQQRVLLARALCATEKVLLLDEPVAGLDPLATKEFYQLVQRLNQEQHLTIIMVSHDIHSVAQEASHVLHLGKEQLFYGDVASYFKTDLAKGFLGGEENV